MKCPECKRWAALILHYDDATIYAHKNKKHCVVWKQPRMDLIEAKAEERYLETGKRPGEA